MTYSAREILSEDDSLVFVSPANHMAHWFFAPFEPESSVFPLENGLYTGSSCLLEEGGNLMLSARTCHTEPTDFTQDMKIEYLDEHPMIVDFWKDSQHIFGFGPELFKNAPGWEIPTLYHLQ